MSDSPNWILRQLTAFRRWVRPLRALEVDDVPDLLNPDVAYLVGEDGLLWSAAFVCPCGCGAAIQLSLVERDRPRWRVVVEPNGTITLSPSVWRTRGCGSHFFVRQGRIRWARPTETEN